MLTVLSSIWCVMILGSLGSIYPLLRDQCIELAKLIALCCIPHEIFYHIGVGQKLRSRPSSGFKTGGTLVFSGQIMWNARLESSASTSCTERFAKTQSAFESWLLCSLILSLGENFANSFCLFLFSLDSLFLALSHCGRQRTRPLFRFLVLLVFLDLALPSFNSSGCCVQDHSFFRRQMAQFLDGAEW